MKRRSSSRSRSVVAGASCCRTTSTTVRRGCGRMGLSHPPRNVAVPNRKRSAMLIDCGECTMKDTSACDDCIVSFLLDRPEGAVVFDVAEERALRVLHDGGLTAPNRFTPLSG